MIEEVLWNVMITYCIFCSLATPSPCHHLPDVSQFPSPSFFSTAQMVDEIFWNVMITYCPQLKSLEGLGSLRRVGGGGRLA